MQKKISYLLGLIILTLGCWWTASLYLGSRRIVESIFIVIIGWLFILLLVMAVRRSDHRVWIFAGLLILVGWSLPASMFVKFFPIQTGEPFGLPLSFTLLAIFSLALIVAALLLDSGLNLLNQWQIEQAKTNDTAKEAGYPKHRHTGKVAIATLVLSAILLARALYYFYWFMIWDTTYDGLGYLWLPIPFLAILSSTFILSITLPENIKLAALFYLLLIPAMIVISTRIQRVDFRQLTEERAERVNQAIENYYIQEGRYPNNLQDLTPWFMPIIPGPVIIYGQEWCYDGGDHYYRLGYIDREHWSAPHFIGRIYRANGDIPDLPGICEQEAAALQQRHPDFPYEYWVEGE